MKMINQLLMICLSVLLITSCAVKPPLSDKDQKFEVIIPADGKSSDELYIISNEWFVNQFNSAESVIEFQDKESGKILGKYIGTYSAGMYFYQYKSTIDVSIKDNKVRLSVMNTNTRATSSVLGGDSYNHEFRPISDISHFDKIKIDLNKLADTLEAKINSTNSDW